LTFISSSGVSVIVLKLERASTFGQGFERSQSPKRSTFAHDCAKAWNIPIGKMLGRFVADSAETTGLKWAAPSAATTTYTLLNAGGTALTAAATITVNISAYNKLFIRVVGASTVSASGDFRLRFNGDTGNNYYFYGLMLEGTTVTSDDGPSDQLKFAKMGNNAANTASGFLIMDGANSTGIKPYSLGTFAQGSTSNLAVAFHGYYGGSSAVTSVSIIAVTGGNFDAGTIYVYGAN
jgi:hypothetical protein